MLCCNRPSAPPISDVARTPFARGMAAAGWTAAALLILWPLLTCPAGAQTTTLTRKTAPGPMGKLAGQVLGADGKPAAKATVYCQSSDGRTPRAAKTDAQGHFRLTCPAGPVDVRATAGETPSAWIRNVRIRTGETTSITIHIAAPESGQEKKDLPAPPQS